MCCGRVSAYSEPDPLPRRRRARGEAGCCGWSAQADQLRAADDHSPARRRCGLAGRTVHGVARRTADVGECDTNEEERQAGIEPATSLGEPRRSDQLSYSRTAGRVESGPMSPTLAADPTREIGYLYSEIDQSADGWEHGTAGECRTWTQPRPWTRRAKGNSLWSEKGWPGAERPGHGRRNTGPSSAPAVPSHDATPSPSPHHLRTAPRPFQGTRAVEQQQQPRD